MHLQGLDLNLLIALDALLTERNVTRAAERIHISQPGMSSALQKLRHHFSDQLLERIGRNMELTARGRALAEPVKSILSQVRELSEEASRFDPATARRVFRIAATTYGCELLAAPLIVALGRTAPLVSVEFEELAPDTAERILDGRVDFAITISARLLDKMDSHDEHFHSEKLFTDSFVVAVAKDNACPHDAVSFDELCAMGYVETRFGGTIAGISEQLWRQQPRQPHISCWLPNFHLTLDTIGKTDMATILPRLLVSLQGERYNVRALPVPFEMPILEERLYWHKRNDNDPGHRWIADMLRQITLG
ncbi:LysR family transcriptional regulator [Sphingobium sp.]|uniref:LysR family transcriptional regulator n=1 Tax=Sphingobium sp. TaxID=1912891 RepID=UPI002B9963C8|nr:LysR family transcriptional regulator [Sphingobium sp.]HUD93482.1 LysR family transcriptional regulator [Sphingobium sp.]